MKFFIFLFFPFAICYYDASPPDPADINDTRPKLVLNMSGFSSGARAYIRFWDGTQAYAFPSSYALFTDVAGRLQTEISLSINGGTADILVYVDENKNGTLENLDFGYYQSGIVIDSQSLYTNLEIQYQTGTLVTYNSVAALPAAGRKICVYMPPGTSAYSTGLNDILPVYPDWDDVTLTTTDWFPVTILDTTGIVSNVPLLSSWMVPYVNETCVPE